MLSYEGVTEPYFYEKGIKTSAQVYQDTILEKVVKPLNNTMFNNQVWSFQQDSAPGHKARSTLSWLEVNVSDFIRAEDWPSSSPDHNPLDYDLWPVLESTACSNTRAVSVDLSAAYDTNSNSFYSITIFTLCLNFYN